MLLIPPVSIKNKINIGHSNEFLTNASLHCSSTPTPEPTPTSTPNPAPQPSTQPIQESTQQAHSRQLNSSQLKMIQLPSKLVLQSQNRLVLKQLRRQRKNIM